ncbi:PucR family transcriptional regulator ligand-binding domain-containing protein [Bacillus aquiflavi]|uniref:PucR family transcriptional regulator n=1 Tax=Bacillus aquiflavi TaxID=2672567 RepID=A0A6B3VWM7_9BACI|nr:PucR family transcriptional regulator [Bacillus aquiflavi]MBA4536309.1 PucR family transcriptional regulator ligand-binding domain-containing protein [Bacillus aquiflavi]NEY80677.1 PucR family transcriptional regulator [Bacillus aquiflavi]
MRSYLSVEEILTRKHFECSEVVAGIDGVTRSVKWVHVVEVTNIKKLLNGQELILSTGVGWKENDALFRSFLLQLIESDAAGLCIEIGAYTSKIPDGIIALANSYSFPLILFHEEVPFVEITQDIHSLLINQHYEMISNLESYSQQLNKNSLQFESYEEILLFLHEYIHVDVMLIFEEIEAVVPNLTKNDQEEILQKMKEGDKLSTAHQPVQVFGNEYAQLMIHSKNRSLTEFDLLILDRTVTAIAQHFMRNLFVEEKKRNNESEWIKEWLSEGHSEEVIREYLMYYDPERKWNGGVVCICKLYATVKRDHHVDDPYFKLIFRTIFEQQGFAVFITEIRDRLVFILINKRSKKAWKARMKEGFQRIKNAEFVRKQKFANTPFAIGKYVNQLSEIHKSYFSAIETLKLINKLSKNNDWHFYEDLHMYRLISLINRHTDLQEIVMEYLEPVIQYDKKYNGQLMETLKTYLAYNGSKQKTAKHLFIVRQTLYHRLEKLETLLGKDFMTSEKRLAIEFMMLAYDYLISTKQVIHLQYEH